MDTIGRIKQQLADIMAETAQELKAGKYYFLEDQLPGDYSNAVEGRDTEVFGWLIGSSGQMGEKLGHLCSVTCLPCSDTILVYIPGRLMGRAFRFSSPEWKDYLCSLLRRISESP